MEEDENDGYSSQPVISKEIMDEYSKKFGFLDWFLTSAKDNINLDVGTRRLVQQVGDKLILGKILFCLVCQVHWLCFII